MAARVRGIVLLRQSGRKTLQTGGPAVAVGPRHAGGRGAGRAGGGGCQPTTPPPPLFPNRPGHSSPIGTIWLIPPGKEVPERGLSVLFSPTRYALWKAVKMSGVSDPNNRRHNLSGFLFRPRRRVVQSCVILLRFLQHA